MIKYPIGLQDFRNIRQDDYIYVDKTSFLPELMNAGKYLFLSRPCRFGKSKPFSNISCQVLAA